MPKICDEFGCEAGVGKELFFFYIKARAVKHSKCYSSRTSTDQTRQQQTPKDSVTSLYFISNQYDSILVVGSNISLLSYLYYILRVPPALSFLSPKKVKRREGKNWKHVDLKCFFAYYITKKMCILERKSGSNWPACLCNGYLVINRKENIWGERERVSGHKKTKLHLWGMWETSLLFSVTLANTAPAWGNDCSPTWSSRGLAWNNQRLLNSADHIRQPPTGRETDNERDELSSVNQRLLSEWGNVRTFPWLARLLKPPPAALKTPHCDFPPSLLWIRTPRRVLHLMDRKWGA